MTIYVDEDAKAYDGKLPPIDLSRVDPRDRRIILVASELAREEMKERIDWRAVAGGVLPLASGAVQGAAGIGAAAAAAAGLAVGAWIAAPAAGLLGTWWLARKLFGAGSRPVLPYPALDPRDARRVFQFPLDHPIDSLAYACSEAEPRLYVPLAGFHRYMYEAKLAAFNRLCSRLGAKRCAVEYAEEDGKEVTGRARVSTPTGSVGVSGAYESRASESATTSAEYDRPKGPPEATDSGWIRGEPSWSEMQRARLENGIARYRAEFSYASDMGIDAAVEAKVRGIGIKTGGSFEAFRRRRWIFDVSFWPAT